MVELYITHYVSEELAGYNDVVIDCLWAIHEATVRDGVPYKLVVLYYASTDALENDLRDRLPDFAEAIRVESSVQPYIMNQATEHAKKRGAELFACLHNDIRPARSWLRNWVSDLHAGEAKYGYANVIASPRYIPYHWLAPHESAYKYPAFWDRIRPELEAKVLSRDAMAGWCARTRFGFDGRLVLAPEKSYLTDDGHQLMMYMCSPSFFDDIGGCDETFAGLNYGDCDWGIRALMAGKKNMISQGALLGHISGLTFFNPVVTNRLYDNHNHFIDKWGLAMFQELQSGRIWTRLHRGEILR